MKLVCLLLLPFVVSSVIALPNSEPAFCTDMLRHCLCRHYLSNTRFEFACTDHFDPMEITELRNKDTSNSLGWDKILKFSIRGPWRRGSSKVLPSSLFSAFPKLRSISIGSVGRMHILPLEANAFSGLNNLMEVEIYDNGFLVIPSMPFEHITSKHTVRITVKEQIFCVRRNYWLVDKVFQRKHNLVVRNGYLPFDSKGPVAEGDRSFYCISPETLKVERLDPSKDTVCPCA